MDGYYISAYLTPPGPPRILDLWLRHDCAVALWKKTGERVELVHYWELERLTGLKEHGTAFWTPTDQDDFILELIGRYGLTWADIQDVWGCAGSGHRLWRPAPHDGLSVHAVAHAYSALMTDTSVLRHSPVLSLAVDGGPDHVLESRSPRYWYAGTVHVPGRAPAWFAPESPGKLFHVARERFGRREGTLMALASATPVEVEADCAQLLHGTSFRDARSDGFAESVVDTAAALVRHALPVVPEVPGFSPDDVYVSAVMKIIGRLAQTMMVDSIEQILREHDLDPSETYLALSGGFALNCPTNTYLLDHFGFRGLLSPPAVSDCGQALGIGLWGFSDLAGGPDRVSFRLGHAYHGDPAGTLDPGSEVSRFVVSTAPWAPMTFAKDVEDGPVVWVEGRSELGPRALGHRSILADPRSAAAKDRLNATKRREWWRPVAPVVLEERVAEWFDLSRTSPFMLEAPVALDVTREQAPAVCHLDGTARVQTIRAEDAPLLHAGIAAFESTTGIPMLCNTSLNDAGEPIVSSAEQAITFALRKGIEVCYVDGTRYELALDPDGADRPVPERPGARAFAPDRRPDLEAALNPAGLPGTTLYTWLKAPSLLQKFDIADAEQAARLHDLVERSFERDPGRRETVEHAITTRRSRP